MRIFSRMLVHTSKKKSVYSLGFVLFFWTLFDGLVSYATPVLITDNGISNTVMGLILSTSSVFGIIFDFVLATIIKRIDYRRIFIVMLLISSLYPMLLWSAKTIPFYIFCMAIWGLYYDLYSFGMGDFKARSGDYSDNAENGSILSVFSSCGYLVAPLLTSVILSTTISSKYYAIFFVLISVFLYIVFLSISKKDKSISPPNEEFVNKSLREQLPIWSKVMIHLFPVLAFTFVIYVFDSIIWTIGPLLTETFPDFPNFGGFFVMVSMLPGLAMGALAPKVMKLLGKKRSAFLCFGLSNLVLIPILFVKAPIFVLLFTLISSLLGYISFPAIQSAFSDYIARSKTCDREIYALQDVFVNLGYVIGPALIGFLSDKFGGIQSIAYMAMFGVILSFIFIFSTPKKLEIIE